jgi:hypothetical protein
MRKMWGKKERNELHMVAQTFNPSTWEVEAEGLQFEASPGKKFRRAHLNQ